MDIAFRVRDVEVPDSLRRATREKVTRLGTMCGIERADVCFSERRNPRIAEREVCAITLFGPGRILRAEAAATEVAVAAERVVGKLEHRANRLRGRLLGRRLPRGAIRLECPISPYAPPYRAEMSTGSVHFSPYWSPVGAIPGSDQPALEDPASEDRAWEIPAWEIPARDIGVYRAPSGETGIRDSDNKPMTPEEAALEMAEQGSDIFLFMNAETGLTAAVYRRLDGDIALSESPSQSLMAVPAGVGAGADPRS